MAPVYESDGELRVFEGSKGEEMWVEPVFRFPKWDWRKPLETSGEVIQPLIEHRVWKRVR